MRDTRDLCDERLGGKRDASDTGGIGSLVSRVTRVTLVIVAALALAAVVAESASAQSFLNRNRNGRNNRSSESRSSRSSRSTAPTAPDSSETEAEDADPSALNWDAAPVDIVLQAYGERVGKTVLKDPACPSATITLKTRPGQKLTDEEYIEAIETILEMNGVHIEPYGESFVRALPRKDVRKEGIPLIMDPEAKLGETSRTVSMMIPFKNIATDEAQKVLEGLRSNNGILLVFERTNSILVTDTEQNINRMLEIARAVDVATPVLENVFVRQVKNASAQDIKTALEAIVQESQKEQEKNGKTVNQNQAQQQHDAPRPPLLGSTLRRPGQTGNQPAAAANNQSLVMNVSDADRGMIRGKVLILADERSNKLIIVTMKSNMDFFDKVIEQLDVETTPDTVVKVYRLKYALAEDVSDMINDLIGNAPSSKGSSKANQNQNAKQGSGGNLTRNTPTGGTPAAKKSANQRTGDVKAGELNKENTTVLHDKRINGLVVMTQRELVPTLEQIIESMDIKLSQVLIETVIIEVGLGDGIETGLDWVQKGREKVYGVAKDEQGRELFHKQREISLTKDGSAYSSSTSVLSDLVPSTYPATSSTSRFTTTEDGKEVTWVRTVTDSVSTFAGTAAEVARTGAMNYYTGGMATALGGGESGGSQAYNIASGVTSNLFGKTLTFVFDSDKLGLSAILQASKTDDHSKYIASPVVMTVDNKEATIDATENRQFITGWSAQSGSYGNSGKPTPNYSAKDIGIKLKITPKINPNGTVMLTVEEEYSQVKYNGQTMLVPFGETYDTMYVDIAVERKMTADVLLEDGQTVVFAGMTETAEAESEKGIPYLKDLPWIGWLFGSVSKTETRKELLIFLTPYVLDEADAAQAEAIRRKKTLSDPRPWDDHGWSASKLADPVSKREQLRRLKDEWKKQDEERKTKIAIETEKVERAKKLQSLSKEERDLWLKMHKEELEEEKQKELEEKMLDKESQEELKKLAEDVRAKKLAAAEKEIKANEELTHSDNERTKLDAEKAEKAKAKAEKQDAEAKSEPVAEVKPEPVAEVKPEPVAEVKPEPVAEVKPAAEAKPEAAKPIE
ncbi:MAG: hypothetical protein IJH50_01575 [Kiritimatiellae bacterium]|nr:hypothetical protein [Kiritimatiellia bacterium]